MFKLNQHDLGFILKQIKVAERHVASSYTAYVDEYGVPIGNLVPYGLRTVSGVFNNLVFTDSGAADLTMPRLLTPTFRAAGDNPFMPGVQTTSYAQPAGTVFDSTPRTISNLVADQSLQNDAAIYAALAALGSANPFNDAAALIAARNANDSATVAAEIARLGLTVENGTVVIPNVMADLGDTAPFNSFMTLFGQFFDHGLDLTAKGGSGTVYIPLQPDDPLYVAGSPLNFMVLTRATNQPGPDGVLGTADDVREHVNKTTPWIDLNQVYTSHESHQVFLREYALVDGKPVATGRMLEGAAGGPPTWADIKAQARELLGIALSDADVQRIPLVATDLYGNFIPGAGGFAQLVTPDGLVEGNPAAPAAAAGAIATGHAFLEDIAHTAVPVVSNGQLQPDADTDTGNSVPTGQRGNNLAYDNELLDKHYVVGDGRGNENIGLTAVHHVFHSEHNHRVEQIQAELLAGARDSGDLAFLNEWLAQDVTALPADAATLQWDGARLFQAARFSTEMVYQHLVFEEFARVVSPTIDPFVFSNNVDIDGAILAEFAHVVYRFGHSMLNENVDRLSVDAQAAANIGLIEAFLNPVEYAASGVTPDAAAGAIIRGMSRQTGNEIDEFVTEALRNNLVGLPLDLAAINIARGRDTGVPSLNEARRQFFEQTGDTGLAPYASWADFSTHLKNPASVINFIAAYGSHASISAATTLDARRDAASALVFGGPSAPADRLDFLNATGAYAGGTLGGLNDVDFWIGGLAEAKMPFGGMLGSSFTFVFEVQMERLQAGDRFYYLSRTQGLNILNQLEADSFAELVMRNTDLGDPNATHLPSSLFLTPAYTLELDLLRQRGADPTTADPFALKPLVVRQDLDGDGDGDLLQFTGDEHVVLGGTQEDDQLVGGAGDDTLWGDGGNDRLEGGLGVDHLFGGAGDDVLTDAGNDVGAGDVLHGDDGHDAIHGGQGLDLIFGGRGQDLVIGGTDAKDITGGEGNDFLRGGTESSVVKGNEGDDWLEGGSGSTGLDTLAGENSELFFNSSIIGHDVMDGRGGDTDYDAESGDDIMVQGLGIQRNNGMAGFDWATFKGHAGSGIADLGVSAIAATAAGDGLAPLPATVTARIAELTGQPVLNQDQQAFILRDRYDLTEAVSGWRNADVLIGRDVTLGQRGNGAAAQFGANDPFLSYANVLTQEGVDRIQGLDALVAHLPRATVSVAGQQHTIVVTDGDAVLNGAWVQDVAADILMGGGGDDMLLGKAQDDILDGDRWLNVRIALRDAQGQEIGSADGLSGQVRDAQGRLLFDGRTLETLVFSREVNPGQLAIVREVLDGDATDSATDIAVFRGARGEYDISVNADQSLTVRHARVATAALDDGTDRVFNMEVLRFADGDAQVADILNPPPEITSDGGGDTASLVVAENTTAVTTVTAVDQVTPAGALRYAIVNGPDAAFFAIDAASGVLQFVNAPDFEARAAYTVTVEVSDGARTDRQTLFVDIANVDEVGAGQVRLSAVANAAGTAANLSATQNLSDPDGFTSAPVLQWQRLVNGSWTDIAGATGADLANQSAGTLRAVGRYSDPFGAREVASVEAAIVGAGAADTLTSRSGSDIVLGLNGNDTLQAAVGDGDDRFSGGAGTDTYSLAATTADATVNLRTGSAGSAQTGTDTLTEIENVTGGGGNDLITDGAGANALNGGAGNDRFVIAGDNQRDVLVGGAGADVADYAAATAALTVVLNGATAATVTGSGSTAANADTVAGIEQLIGGSGNDSFTGDAADNRLDGGAGNDLLSGGGGNDVLLGGAGADVLTGGAGVDNLTGGAGADRFVYTAVGQSAPGARDLIQDFQRGLDRIDLSAIDANTGVLALGDQAFSFTANGGSAAFTGAAQLRFFYDAANNVTVVQGNVDANLAPDFELTLVGNLPFTPGDFTP